MINSSLSLRFGAVSVLALALAACGSQAPEPEAAPDAPPVSQPAATPETPEPPAMPEVEPAAVGTEADDAVAPADDTAGQGEEHSHDDGEGHSHDHSDGHEHDHSHDDHGHDHDGHDHAGGAPHVHGEAEGAVILEGDTLTVSLDSALASFGLKETAPANDAEEAERQAVFDALRVDTSVVVVNADAGCALTESSQAVRSVGEVGNAVLDYTYTCANPGALTQLTFTIFEGFATMEKINLAVLIGDGQDAVTLTAASPEVSLD